MIILTDMMKDQVCKINRFEINADEEAPDMIERLREMGFEEGAEIIVRHEGMIGRDPIAVDIDGMRVALRRKEASLIYVAAN